MNAKHVATVTAVMMLGLPACSSAVEETTEPTTEAISRPAPVCAPGAIPWWGGEIYGKTIQWVWVYDGTSTTGQIIYSVYLGYDPATGLLSHVVAVEPSSLSSFATFNETCTIDIPNGSPPAPPGQGAGGLRSVSPGYLCLTPDQAAAYTAAIRAATRCTGGGIKYRPIFW